MMITAGELERILGGKLMGDSNKQIVNLDSVEQAGPQSLVLVFNQKFVNSIARKDCGTVLIDKQMSLPETCISTVIQVTNIHKAMQIVQEKFLPKKKVSWNISTNAEIHHSAKISEQVSIGSFVVVEANAEIGNGTIIWPQVFIGDGVKIGEGCTLHSGVKIYSGTEIGNDVIVHSNAVLGGDGFGYHTDPTGIHHKILHQGKLIIGNNVEVGSCTTLDRATFDETRIADGVKLDNLVQIGHNVRIQENSIIAAQTGIAGSAYIGKNVVMGGQTGIAGHVEIADGVRIQGKSGVAGHVREKNSRLFGYPAIAYYEYLRAYSIFKNLPNLKREIQSLKKELIKFKERNKKKDI